MIVYVRCNNCDRKEKITGESFSYNECPTCKSNSIDLYMGSVPGWWTAEDEQASTSEPARMCTHPVNATSCSWCGWKATPSVLIDRTIRVRFSPIDPFIVGLAIYLGFVEDPWWLVLAPLTVGSWFFNPRWSKATGWRFLHDRES